MKLRGIVFDKDGTLLDFNRTWLPIYRHASREFADGDAEIAEALLTANGYDAAAGRFIGGSLLAAGNNHQIAEAWAVQLGLPAQREQIGERLNRIFQQQGALMATAVEGLAATLVVLQQAGLKLGVATADSQQGITNTLQAFDVLDRFDFLAGYDSGHGVKPEPGMIRAFCASTGLEVEQVAMVGDNRHDIEMGRNAGVGLCVGVLTGTSTRAELAPLADLVLDDIRGLPEVVGI